MMKLSFSHEAQEKLASKMAAKEVLLLDLDDGIGPLSPVLGENGLLYRIFICPQAKIPDDFTEQLQTSLGPVYFTDETAFYLDENMEITYKKVQNRLELQSDQAILEPNLNIIHL